MSRANIQPISVISIAVMLLMAAALISGESGASARQFENSARVVATPFVGDQMRLNLDRYFEDKALRISFAVATEFSHFRGEDE
jgi:hypothetical protein